MKTTSLSLLLALALPAACTFAATPEQVERLGKDLTPMGAEQAANADGTIPAWTGGISTAPAGYTQGQFHQDPFASETALFTITADNLAQYESRLTAGQIALLKTYKDYKIPVFQTHRTAAYPQRVYDATKACATTAKLTADGNGFSGALVGIPFPIPQNGLEVIWNHLARYRGMAASRHMSQAAPQRNGNYSLVEIEDEFLFNYVRPDVTEKDLNNILVYYKQSVVAPAKFAGSILLVHETLDQVKEPRNAWSYNPGTQRVRRAPNIAYDAPGTYADSQRTSDQFDMFNGAPDRYEWKLQGKRELIVPYNSYKLHSDKVKVDDILRPLHINQDLTRYEQHRVWVVEATLKPGASHIYSKRTFYIDEDSWQILAIDQYDNRGQLWRISEAHCIQFWDAQTFWSTLEVHTDIQSGRYLAIGLDNQSKPYDFTIKRTLADYSSSTLRREGTR